jgi:hypothetical protein
MVFHIALVIIVATGTIIFAVKSRDFRKILAGAFFVAAGGQMKIITSAFSLVEGDSGKLFTVLNWVNFFPEPISTWPRKPSTV